MAFRLFESFKLAQSYVKYRPSYKKDTIKECLDYIRATSGTPVGSLGSLYEVGCGSGQATKAFAPYFDKVVATDVSPEQIKVAKLSTKLKNVCYRNGSAESLQCEDNSVDVVLSAQSAHWFQLDSFYKETKRVLKPNGSLLIIGYSMPLISPIINGNEIQHFGNHFSKFLQEKLLSYSIHTKQAAEPFKQYSNVFAAIPTENKQKKVIRQPFADPWYLDDVKGFLYSIGIFQLYIEKQRNEIISEKGSCSEEDLKKYDIFLDFLNYVKEKLVQDGYYSDPVEFKVAFEVFILKSHFNKGV